jgi:hypothetical protein
VLSSKIPLRNILERTAVVNLGMDQLAILQQKEGILTIARYYIYTIVAFSIVNITAREYNMK